MSRLDTVSLIPRGATRPCTSSSDGIDRDHAARRRSYLHEELGPGGGVLHHAVHHTDESLALTHLQQRKERTDCSHSDPLRKLPASPCACSRKQGRAAALGLQHLCLASPPLAPVNSVSEPAPMLPQRKGHKGSWETAGPLLTAQNTPQPRNSSLGRLTAVGLSTLAKAVISFPVLTLLCTKKKDQLERLISPDLH